MQKRCDFFMKLFGNIKKSCYICSVVKIKVFFESLTKTNPPSRKSKVRGAASVKESEIVFPNRRFGTPEIKKWYLVL